MGKIVGTESKGPTGCDCWAIAFPSGLRAFIPVDSATTMLRPLISRSEAEGDLAILRGECTVTDNRHSREIREERERILRAGSSNERARILRTLYAARQPISDSNATAIRAFEDVVLEEISLVIGIERSELENEMRERYPVSTKKNARSRH